MLVKNAFYTPFYITTEEVKIYQELKLFNFSSVTIFPHA